MKSVILTSVSIVLLAFTSTFSTAYPSAESPEQIEEQNDLEVIEVYGQKPLGRLKLELRDHKIAMYNIFNSMIDDEDLMYVCRKEQVGGSYRTFQICEPRFLTRIKQGLITEELLRERNLNRDNWLGTLTLASLGSEEIATKRAEMVKLMEELTINNLEFRQAVVRVINAEKAFVESHRATYGKFSRIENRARYSN